VATHTWWMTPTWCAVAVARKHLNVHGRYTFALPELPGGRRPLRDPVQSRRRG
jgi:hypothetical protein